MVNEIHELWDLLGKTGIIDTGDFHVMDITDDADIEEMQVLRIYHKDGWCIQLKGFYDEDEIGELNEPEYDEDEDEEFDPEDDDWPLPIRYEFTCIWSPNGGIALTYVLNLIKDYIANKNASIDDLINNTLNF